MREPKNIRVYRIDDLPGYRWEINWLDDDGEEWSEECEGDDSLFERFRQIIEDDETGVTVWYMGLSTNGSPSTE